MERDTLAQTDKELAFIVLALQSTTCVEGLKPYKDLDWDTLFNKTIRHRLWHQVFAAIKPLMNEVPESFFERLQQYCQLDKLRIIKTASETARIASAFTGHSLFHCFIKGMVLNVTLYPSLSMRPCKDIDLWVHPDDFPRASAVLETLGYQKKAPNYELKGLQKRYYMRHKYDIAFYNPKKRIEVELHFKLTKFAVNFPHPTTENTKSIKIFNTSVQTLDDDYNLLYLMLHGARHAFNRLRWLYDIALYLKSGNCDLLHVTNLARDIDCEHIVEQSLLLVQETFGPRDSTLSSLILNPSKRSIYLMNTAQDFISADYEFTPKYSLYNKMFFKYRFYLATLAPFGEKLQVVLGDLFKIDKLFPYVRFPDWCFFMYYLLYPFWIMKLFISR